MAKRICATFLSLFLCTSTLSGQIGLTPVATTNIATSSPESIERSDPLKFSKLTIIDEISVPAEEAGVLDELNVKEGDLVEKGFLLAKIDNKDAKLAMEMAKYEYESAKKAGENNFSVLAAAKARDLAEVEWKASKDANLDRPGVVPEMQVRRNLLQMERAALQKDLALHELAIAGQEALAKYNQYLRAKGALERREIRSRLNGVVVKLHKHAGDWVQPGETVMRIVRMDQLRVEGSIDGAKFARHEVMHRPVRITVMLTGGATEQLEGTIQYASSLIESNEFTVRSEVNNRKVNGQWLLNPGLNASIELVDGAPATRRIGQR